MTTSPAPIFASRRNLDMVGAMLARSHDAPMTTEKINSWGHQIDISMAPKAPETSWIFGTPHWHSLTHQERRELLWLETARDISNLIHLKQNLPPILMAYLMAFSPVMAPEMEEYLAVVAKEKLVHLAMLRRHLELAGLPLFPPSQQSGHVRLGQILTGALKTTPPIVVVLLAVVLEWVADANAMHYTQAAGAEPVTRKMFAEHHVDAQRHIDFGKAIVEDFFATREQKDLDPIRAMLTPVIGDVFDELVFSDHIGQFTSFPYPVEQGDAAAIELVRRSDNNAKLNELRFKEIKEWLGKLGLLKA